MFFPQQSTCRDASRHRRAASSATRRLEPAAARAARYVRERRLVPPRRQPSEGARRRLSRCTAAPVATAGGRGRSSGATVLSVTPLVAAPAPSAPRAAACRAGRDRTSAGAVLVRFLRAGACVSPPRHRSLPLLLSHRLRRTSRRRSRSPACKRGTPTCLRQRYLLHTPLIDECAEYSRPQPGPGQLAARKTLAKHARHAQRPQRWPRRRYELCESASATLLHGATAAAASKHAGAALAFQS